ncbi:MAG: hypothetical protein GX140_04225 [Bacteroidales bacterium]|jgi:hypothetical protein|nr:hypothetical protein [Bacteroidales bacterium]
MLKKLAISLLTLFLGLNLLLAQSGEITVNKSYADGDIKISDEHISLMEIPDSVYFDGLSAIKIEGTDIYITPPKAFRLKDGSNNLLVQDWTSSNILIQQMPVSYKSMIANISAETFTKQGFEYINKYEAFTKSGNEGTVYVLGFVSGEWEYERLVLLSGDGKKTAWISANYPVMMKHLLFEVLEKSILNIEF